MEKEDCVFCKIVNGKIPSAMLYSDESVIAILDINPISEGHSLVIPRKHFEYLETIDPGTFSKVAEVARKLSSHIIKTGFSEGTNLFLANHEKADQTIFHLHMHVIPRREGDGINIGTWWKETSLDLESSKVDSLKRKLSFK